MRDWETRGPPGGAASRRLERRLERRPSELPRGGKDIASQIGSELRAVFAVTDELFGAADLLAEIDLKASTAR